MNEQDFAKLSESIQQAGKVRRGAMRASRITTVEPQDVRAIRAGLDKTQRESGTTETEGPAQALKS